MGLPLNIQKKSERMNYLFKPINFDLISILSPAKGLSEAIDSIKIQSLQKYFYAVDLFMEKIFLVT
jgi:hypothetical protein